MSRHELSPGEWCANCGLQVLEPQQGPDDVPLCKGCHTNWVRAGRPDEIPARKHAPADLSRTPAPPSKPERPVLPGKYRLRKVTDLRMDKPYEWHGKNS